MVKGSASKKRQSISPYLHSDKSYLFPSSSFMTLHPNISNEQPFRDLRDDGPRLEENDTQENLQSQKWHLSNFIPALENIIQYKRGSQVAHAQFNVRTAQVLRVTPYLPFRSQWAKVRCRVAKSGGLIAYRHVQCTLTVCISIGCL